MSEIAFENWESQSGSYVPYPSPLNNSTSTDTIISNYEHKLNGTIATKAVEAAKKGKPPVFTKEEWAYLNKKAYEDSPMAEVKVIAPAPTITLKKGNTEINVRNAAALVRKMEEKYPTTTPEPQPEITKETTAFREELKKRVTFNVKDVSPEVKRCVELLPGTTSNLDPLKELPNTPSFIPQLEQRSAVNKNAYELRSDILKFSIDSVNKTKTYTDLDEYTKDVLTIANKFYDFVENKNRNKY